MPRTACSVEELPVFTDFNKAKHAIRNEKHRVFEVHLPPQEQGVTLYVPAGSNCNAAYDFLRKLGGSVATAKDPEERMRLMFDFWSKLTPEQQARARAELDKGAKTDKPPKRKR